MITAEQIEEILIAAFPGGDIQVTDLTGTQDHWEVQVCWADFADMSLIEQHQMINRALKSQIDDGSIHALKIKTLSQKPNVSGEGNSGFNILN